MDGYDDEAYKHDKAAEINTVRLEFREERDRYVNVNVSN